MCMDGAFVKRQDTISTRQSPMSQWHVLTGPWDLETQHRGGYQGKALPEEEDHGAKGMMEKMLLPYSDAAREIGRRSPGGPYVVSVSVRTH